MHGAFYTRQNLYSKNLLTSFTKSKETTAKALQLWIKEAYDGREQNNTTVEYRKTNCLYDIMCVKNFWTVVSGWFCKYEICTYNPLDLKFYQDNDWKTKMTFVHIIVMVLSPGSIICELSSVWFPSYEAVLFDRWKAKWLTFKKWKFLWNCNCRMMLLVLECKWNHRKLNWILGQVQLS